MRKQVLAVGTILIACLASTSNAATQASGWVLFNFNNTPDIVSYQNSQGYFGRVDGVDANFDDDYSTSLSVGDSSIYANWDPVTGNATDYGLNAVNSGGAQGSSSAGINYAIGFSIYTDILSFSYDYSFLGQRSSTDNSNSLSMGLQVEISSGNEIFYTDYSSGHPTFQTNWAYFELEGSQTVLDEAGTITFVYGEQDVFRTWYIGLDVLASGRDTVGVVPLPASLPLMLGALTFLAAVRRRPTRSRAAIDVRQRAERNTR